jgi:hypothetical protein
MNANAFNKVTHAQINQHLRSILRWTKREKWRKLTQVIMKKVHATNRNSPHVLTVNAGRSSTNKYHDHVNDDDTAAPWQVEDDTFKNDGTVSFM